MDPESDHENRGGDEQDVADHWRHCTWRTLILKLMRNRRVAAVDTRAIRVRSDHGATITKTENPLDLKLCHFHGHRAFDWRRCQESDDATVIVPTFCSDSQRQGTMDTESISSDDRGWHIRDEGDHGPRVSLT